MLSITTRICRICKQEKTLDECFYKKKRCKYGYDNRCKECHCSMSRLRLRSKYSKEKQFVKYQRQKKAGIFLKSAKLQALKFPEKHKARYKLRAAVKYGKVLKSSCEVCGNSKVEAHHNDYSKPLEVVWLCKRHHADIHLKPIIHPLTE